MEKFLLKNIAIIVTRTKADITNRGCLTASLAEAAITTGSRRMVNTNELNSKMGVDQSGNTPIVKLFNHLRRGADALNLEVVEVLANQGFLDHCDNPTDQLIEARTVTGTVGVLRPHIRVMANECGALHSELDDGSKRSTRRIKNLEKRGWFSAAAIVVRTKTK